MTSKKKLKLRIAVLRGELRERQRVGVEHKIGRYTAEDVARTAVAALKARIDAERWALGHPCAGAGASCSGGPA